MESKKNQVSFCVGLGARWILDASRCGNWTLAERVNLVITVREVPHSLIQDHGSGAAAIQVDGVLRPLTLEDFSEFVKVNTDI